MVEDAVVIARKVLQNAEIAARGAAGKSVAAPSEPASFLDCLYADRLAALRAECRPVEFRGPTEEDLEKETGQLYKYRTTGDQIGDACREDARKRIAAAEKDICRDRERLGEAPEKPPLHPPESDLALAEKAMDSSSRSSPGNRLSGGKMELSSLFLHLADSPVAV